MNSIVIGMLLLFSIVSIISILLGLYIIYLSPHVLLNRMFLMVSIALAIWSFAFAMAINANEESVCLFWRRISAIGWSTIHAHVLIVLLIIAGKKDFFTHKWKFILIYIPAMINLYIFAISDRYAALQYNLYRGNYGWTNIAVNNGWDYFFYFYYSLYLLTGLIVLLQWIRRSQNKKKRRYVISILVSSAVAAVLGTLSDFVINVNFQMDMPQISPIFYLIPFSAIYMNVSNHNFMRVKGSKNILSSSKTNSDRFYNALSLFFISIGLLFLTLQGLFVKDDIVIVFFLLGCIIIIFGIFVNILRIIKISNNDKEKIIALFVGLLIPVVVLSYKSDVGVMILVYQFILIFLYIFSLFNQRRSIDILVISIVLTEVIIWNLYPEATVVIDANNYWVLLGTTGVVIFLAYYLNDVHIKRLRKSEKETEFLDLISKILVEFMVIDRHNFDRKIMNMIDSTGDYFNATSIDIGVIDCNQKKIKFPYQFRNKLVLSAEIPLIRTLLDDTSDINQFIMNKKAYTENIEFKNFVDDEINEKILICSPILVGDYVYGFIQMIIPDVIEANKNDINEKIKIITSLFTNAVGKIKIENELLDIRQHDPLTQLPNETLFKEYFKKGVNKAHKSKTMLGIFYLDLDGFKSINDTYGYEVGDLCLVEVGKRISHYLDKGNGVFRYGGDEFVILLNGCDTEDALLEAAEKVLQSLDEPFIMNGIRIGITAGIGISIYPIHGEVAEELVEMANSMMYKAKKIGKNQSIVYNGND